MKHVHCDLIKAWAEGAKIQIKGFDEDWYDIQAPMWNPNAEYRIKPTLRYRVVLLRDKEGYYTHIASNEESARYFSEVNINFVKWLTDWVEVEL